MNLSLGVGYLLLITQVNCISSSKKESRSSRFDDPEIITVLPQANNQEILSCRLDVKFRNGDTYHFKLYDKKQSFYQNGVLRFIGGDNNTCSFEIILSRSPELFMHDGGSFFTKELTMHEEHECTPWWKSKFFISKCERSYPINLIPQTWWENFRAKYISTTKIIRRANYNNKTITILTPPFEYKLNSCYLLIFKQSNDIIVHDYRFTVSSSTSVPPVEYIGLDDNSCSLRLSTEIVKKEIYSQNCKIIANYYDSDSEMSTIYYDITIQPFSWWQKNKFSRVLLPEEQYF